MPPPRPPPPPTSALPTLPEIPSLTEIDPSLPDDSWPLLTLHDTTITTPVPIPASGSHPAVPANAPVSLLRLSQTGPLCATGRITALPKPHRHLLHNPQLLHARVDIAPVYTYSIERTAAGEFILWLLGRAAWYRVHPAPAYARVYAQDVVQARFFTALEDVYLPLFERGRGWRALDIEEVCRRLVADIPDVVATTQECKACLREFRGFLAARMWESWGEKGRDTAVWRWLARWYADEVQGVVAACEEWRRRRERDAEERVRRKNAAAARKKMKPTRGGRGGGRGGGRARAKEPEVKQEPRGPVAVKPEPRGAVELEPDAPPQTLPPRKRKAAGLEAFGFAKRPATESPAGRPRALVKTERANPPPPPPPFDPTAPLAPAPPTPPRSLPPLDLRLAMLHARAPRPPHARLLPLPHAQIGRCPVAACPFRAPRGYAGSKQLEKHLAAHANGTVDWAEVVRTVKREGERGCARARRGARREVKTEDALGPGYLLDKLGRMAGGLGGREVEVLELSD